MEKTNRFGQEESEIKINKDGQLTLISEYGVYVDDYKFTEEYLKSCNKDSAVLIRSRIENIKQLQFENERFPQYWKMDLSKLPRCENLEHTVNLKHEPMGFGSIGEVREGSLYSLLEVKDPDGRIGYLSNFRNYGIQISGTTDYENDMGSIYGYDSGITENADKLNEISDGLGEGFILNLCEVALYQFGFSHESLSINESKIRDFIKKVIMGENW